MVVNSIFTTELHQRKQRNQYWQVHISCMDLSMLISLLPLVQFGSKDRIYNHNTELPLLPNCPGSLYISYYIYNILYMYIYNNRCTRPACSTNIHIWQDTSFPDCGIWTPLIMSVIVMCWRYILGLTVSRLFTSTHRHRYHVRCL